MDFDFLKSIENALPEKLSPLYALIKKEKEVLGLLYFQVIQFSAGESLKLEQETDELPCKMFFDSLAKFFKKFVANKVSFKALVSGNLLGSGPFGFYFTQDFDHDKQEELLSLSIETLFRYEKSMADVSVCLIKDFPKGKRLTTASSGPYASFTEFKVQPSMNLKVRWNSFEDYLNSMESKYRLRIKKYQQKIASLQLKELTADEIDFYKNEIELLYKNIQDQAGFNMVHLDQNYFYTLKKLKKNDFKFFAYFLDNEMLCFYSYLNAGDILSAHFLGYNKSKNNHYAIYPNVLCNLIQEAIVNQYQCIDLGRTALEIKSSFGAVPEELFCYVAHRSSWYNRFVPKLLDYLVPEEKWTPRSPFKKHTH